MTTPARLRRTVDDLDDKNDALRLTMGSLEANPTDPAYADQLLQEAQAIRRLAARIEFQVTDLDAP